VKFIYYDSFVKNLFQIKAITAIIAHTIPKYIWLILFRINPTSTNVTAKREKGKVKVRFFLIDLIFI
jgi:hypothetical protein